MTYVDGFVIAVPTKNKDAYLKLSREMAPIFKEHGATRVVETWGTDVPEGKVTSFRMAVQQADEETIVFSWIEWPSKAVRDAGMAKLEEHPIFNPENASPPFDGNRMIFGGFEVILDA